jgi:hypothetical protein
MRDTVELNPAGVYLLERFFSRQERAKLFRSWAGAASMWLKVRRPLSVGWSALTLSALRAATMSGATSTQRQMIPKMRRIRAVRP